MICMVKFQAPFHCYHPDSYGYTPSLWVAVTIGGREAARASKPEAMMITCFKYQTDQIPLRGIWPVLRAGLVVASFQQQY